MKVSQKVYQQKLSFSSVSALDELVEIVVNNEKQNINGHIIEAGCALGGSAIVIASAKSLKRPFNVYDTFSMIPSPSEKDGEDVHKFYEKIKSGKAPGIRGSKYYAYQDNLYNIVRTNFLKFDLNLSLNNISLIQGDIKNTMYINFPVSFAHIDCDWYESVMTCLQRIWSNLVVCGTLVIDDYYAWSGCTQAVNEFFNLKDKTEYNFIEKLRLHIIKRS